MEELLKLPAEILLQIFAYLPGKDLLAWAQVSKFWRNFLNSEHFWKEILNRDGLLTECLVPLCNQEPGAFVETLEKECTNKRLYARALRSLSNWRNKRFRTASLEGFATSLDSISYLGNGALMAGLISDGSVLLYDLHPPSPLLIQNLPPHFPGQGYGRVLSAREALLVVRHTSFINGDVFYLIYILHNGLLILDQIVAPVPLPNQPIAFIENPTETEPEMLLGERWTCRVHAVIGASVAIHVWDRKLDETAIHLYSTSERKEVWRFHSRSWSHSKGRLFVFFESEGYIEARSCLGQLIYKISTQDIASKDCAFYFGRLTVAQFKCGRVLSWSFFSPEKMSVCSVSSKVMCAHPSVPGVIVENCDSGEFELRLVCLPSGDVIWRCYLYDSRRSTAEFTLHVRAIGSELLFYVPLLRTGLTDWFILDALSGKRLYNIDAHRSYFVQVANDKLIDFKDVRSSASIVRFLLFT